MVVTSSTTIVISHCWCDTPLRHFIAGEDRASTFDMNGLHLGPSLPLYPQQPHTHIQFSIKYYAKYLLDFPIDLLSIHRRVLHADTMHMRRHRNYFAASSVSDQREVAFLSHSFRLLIFGIQCIGLTVCTICVCVCVICIQLSY